MAKLQKTKIKNHKKLKIVSVSLLGLLVLTLLTAQMLYNFNLHKRIVKLENFGIRTYIYDPLQNANKPAAEDPKTGELFITDAKLKLPRPPEEFNRGMRYSYSPATKDSSETVTITSTAAQEYGLSLINIYYSQDRLFEAVPIAQACTRQIEMYGLPERGGWSDGKEKVTSIKVNDGREFNVYIEPECNFPDKSISEYIQKVESYN